MVPFLAQTAGLHRGKGILVFGNTRGSEMAVQQGTEDARARRGGENGYLHWKAREKGRQGLCKVPAHPPSDQDLEGDVISTISS